MNPEKIGKFIKKIRKDNNLTQKQLADKYKVTYQAVSKWENGKNLPDVSLIQQMSKDFNISVDDILDGKIKTKKKNIRDYIVICSLIIIIIILSLTIIIIKKEQSFKLKKISATCDEFVVSGSLAYDKNKSSIYISNIDYCGDKNTNKYKKIECSVYETIKDNSKKIASYKSEDKEVTLEEYLKTLEINIDNYEQNCKQYNNNSLHLEIIATDKNNKITFYKIPLKLDDNCSK